MTRNGRNGDAPLPKDIFEHGSLMLGPLVNTLTNSLSEDPATDKEAMAAGIYLHAIKPSNPPGMVATMLAAAIVQLAEQRVERQ